MVPLVSTLVFAACSSDSIHSVAPVSAAKEIAPSTDGRYLILASANGFGRDFASRVAALGGSVESIHTGAGIAVVNGITSQNAPQLAKISGVTDVQQDAEVALDAPVATAEADATAAGDPVVESQANPTTASRYAWQWNMRLIGANRAWAAGKLGSSDVTVAIIDTGIDYDALDLNGLVDLSRSAAFQPGDSAISTKYFPSRNPISDYNGHGTNVATQVSSKAVALAGVTSKTKLIGVKVLGANGRGRTSDVLNGVLWAADHGADVANMSLGGAFAKPKLGQLVSLINRVFTYASRKGMLVVVAAGNDGADLDHNGNIETTYCDAPNVVCVSSVGPATGADFATSGANAVSFFTNYGRSSISVAGPGGNATVNPDGTWKLSPWPWATDIASWVWSFCSKTRIAGFTSTGAPVLTVCTSGTRISGFIGTSQATPHVAGLAALLVAEKGHGKPSQIKAAIQQSAIDLGQPGKDPYYGNGRIDVAKALGL
jgi:hypothetical protein